MKLLVGIFSIMLMLASVSCSGEAQKKSQGMQLPVADQVAFLSDIASQQWDGINFNDASITDNKKEMMYLFSKWAEPILELYHKYGVVKTPELVERSQGNNELLVGIMETADECFNNPNSPYRCEELYIPMLETALKTNVDEVYKELYQSKLKKALMNRKGSIATDFNYTTDRGEQGSLYSIENEYTLLYFFNPDCHDCGRVTEFVATSSIINNLIGANKLSVLALYPDKDMAGWDNHQGENPQTWITARYTDLSEREKYDLPAIPNVYLLGKDKKVIIKDGTIEEINYYLEQNAK